MRPQVTAGEPRTGPACACRPARTGQALACTLADIDLMHWGTLQGSCCERAGAFGARSTLVYPT